MELLERHFDTAFDAPDGIKTLRELILTLAMQGKLVPQNPKDTPARELIKTIEREKQLLVKNSTLKVSTMLPPVTEFEKMFVLPESWEWVRLGAIAQHNSGKTLDSGRNSGTSRNYITTSNLYWGRFELDNVRQMLIRDEELERCTATRGDLLVCEGGEAGRAAVWEQDSDVCFQNHIHRVRFYGRISPYYGFRLLEYLNASGEIEKYRKGVGISNMSSKALASIPFPLPPVPEQLRIISRIDELMARCDVLEKLKTERDARRLAVHTAAVRKLLNVADREGHVQAREFLGQHFSELYTVKENVTELRKAILQLAVMGKLVPQNPNDSPASELLKQIEAEKKRLVKEGTIRAPKSLPPLSTDEEPFTLPVGWAWARFSHFTTEIATGPFGSMIHQSDYISGGVPLINPSHMIEGRIVYDPEVSIPPGMAKELQSYRLHQDDIVMARRGEMGRCAIVTSGEDGFLCGTGSFILRFVCEIDRGYILNFFRTEYCREHLGGNSVGTTMTNLNQGILEAMPIPVAPAKEQRRIVAKINQMMSLCDALEQRIDSGSEKQSALLNATMAQLGGQRCA